MLTVTRIGLIVVLAAAALTGCSGESAPPPAAKAGPATPASETATRALVVTARPAAAEAAQAAPDKAATDTPTGDPKAPKANGDTLIEASIGNVSSLIPNITSDAASHEVGDL